MKNIRKRLTYPRALVILLIIQLIILAYSNFVRIPYRFDHDASTAVRHAVDIWRSGTLFIPDFISCSTFEIDCVSFFAAPIYILTGNLGLAMGVVHIIVDGFALCLIFGIMRNLRLSLEYAVLSALLIFTPYTQGQVAYVNMLFYSVGQYEFRVICLLSMLYLISAHEKKTRMYLCSIIISVGFFFITCLSAGIYVLGTVICPFILFELYHIVEKQKFDLKNSSWMIIIIGFIAGGVGCIVHISNTDLIIRNSFNVVTKDRFIENVFSMISGVGEYLGGIPDRSVPLFSFQGIAVLINFLVISFIVMLIIAVIRHYDTTKYKIFLTRASVIIFVNIGILLVLDTSYSRGVEARYNILWLVMVFFVFCVCLSIYIEQETNLWKIRTLKGLILVGLVCMNFAGGYRITRGENSHYYMTQELIDVLPDYDDYEILLYYNDYVERSTAKELNALNLDQYIYLVTLSPEGAPLRRILGSYDHPDLKQNNLLIIKKQSLESLPMGIRSLYSLVEETETWNLYMSDVNPWNGSGTIQ